MKGMKKIALAVALVCLMMPSANASAAAVEQQLTLSDSRYQPFVQQALIPLPRGQVTIKEVPDGSDEIAFHGQFGATDPNTNTIYLGPGGMIRTPGDDKGHPGWGPAEVAQPRHTLYHELGHLLWGRAKPEQRQAFQDIMYDKRDPLATSTYGASNPEERFAEAVALTASRRKIRHQFTGGWYEFKATPRQLQALRELMFQIGGGASDSDQL